MNGRIRELMIRAIADVDSIDDPETRRMYIPNCFAEKFAELIVKECADISEVSFHNGSAGYLAILNYFGVEQ